jgi:hypothetical protein
MTDSERRRLEEMWTRFVAGEALEREERSTLAAALEGDEVLRRRMILDLQLDGALRAAGEVERGQEHVVDMVKALVTAAGRTEEVVAAVRKQLEAKAAAARRGPGRAQRSWGRPVAVGAVVLTGAAALALLLPRLDRPPPSPAEVDRSANGSDATAASRGAPKRWPFQAAPTPGRETVATQPARPIVVGRLEAIDGPAYRHGADGTRRAAPSLELAAGDWVSTSGAGARARLAGPGGSRIELQGDAVAGLVADGPDQVAARFFIAHGRAVAVVPASTGGSPLVLASPHAIVNGTGTMHLEVGASVTRVQVRQGRARVSALGVQRGTDVAAGQLALVSGDDLQPPRTQNAREALLVTGPDDTKEDPAPPNGLRGSEERLKARLERLGFAVTVVDGGDLLPDRARAAALLVLSSSVSSKQLRGWFAELPVPMLVLESTGFEQLGLTGTRWKRDVGPAGPQAEVVITDPSHPLAAGLTGTVRVLSAPLNMRWAAPPPGASVIATYPGAPEQASLLFAYDRAAPTAVGAAPARRVALFLGNGRIIRALTEPGWRLFDAAVLWCADS